MLIALWTGCKHEPWLGYDEDPIPGDTTGTNCDPDTVYYQNTIAPLLVSNCAKPGCHDAITHEKGINFADYNSILSNDIIDVDDPFDSEIWERINETDPDDRMPRPPNPPLTAEQKQLILKWMQQGAKNNACDEGCGTDFNYSSFIRPLVNKKCIGCHSGANPPLGINLTTYQGLKAVADDGRLKGTITGNGYTKMPYGSALPACEVDLIIQWVDAGALEN